MCLRGGAIAYRVALWHPEFITHLFVVCTPYWAPTKERKSLEDLVKTRLPNFKYQLQLASGDIEKVITSRDELRQFLNALYGGRGPNGELGFTARQGLLVENLPKLGPSRLISEKVRCYRSHRSDVRLTKGLSALIIMPMSTPGTASIAPVSLPRDFS